MQRFESLRYKRKTRTVCIRISEMERDLLEDEAKKLGISMDALVREGFLGKVERIFG